jgi:hypothetical protein
MEAEEFEAPIPEKQNKRTARIHQLVNDFDRAHCDINNIIFYTYVSDSIVDNEYVCGLSYASSYIESRTFLVAGADIAKWKVSMFERLGREQKSEMRINPASTYRMCLLEKEQFVAISKIFRSEVRSFMDIHAAVMLANYLKLDSIFPEYLTVTLRALKRRAIKEQWSVITDRAPQEWYFKYRMFSINDDQKHLLVPDEDGRTPYDLNIEDIKTHGVTAEKVDELTIPDVFFKKAIARVRGARVTKSMINELRKKYSISDKYRPVLARDTALKHSEFMDIVQTLMKFGTRKLMKAFFIAIATTFETAHYAFDPAMINLVIKIGKLRQQKHPLGDIKRYYIDAESRWYNKYSDMARHIVYLDECWEFNNAGRFSVTNNLTINCRTVFTASNIRAMSTIYDGDPHAHYSPCTFERGYMVDGSYIDRGPYARSVHPDTIIASNIEALSAGLLDVGFEWRRYKMALTGGAMPICAIEPSWYRHRNAFEDQISRYSAKHPIDLDLIVESLELSDLEAARDYILAYAAKRGFKNIISVRVGSESDAGCRFRITQTDAKGTDKALLPIDLYRNSFTRVAGYHVPVVRMIFNGTLYAHASCALAIMSGICHDYRVYKNRGIEIIAKYIYRGFVFQLNDNEVYLMRKYLKSRQDTASVVTRRALPIYQKLMSA